MKSKCLTINKLGKKVFSKQIVSLIYSILKANTDPPIVLNWHKECSMDYLPTQLTQLVSPKEKIQNNRVSTRSTKIPVTKSNDFLWER
jgi:hypothetical protein